MKTFRKVCAIIGLVTAAVATFCSCKVGYGIITGVESDAVYYFLAFGLSLLSYILAGGVFTMIQSALGFIKYGFVVAPFPLSILVGLAFAAIALCFIPFFPIFFVVKSINQKQLLSA